MSDLPRPFAYLQVLKRTCGYGDLTAALSSHLNAYASLVEYLGPYNARQRSSDLLYSAPTRAELKGAVRAHGMNELSFSAMLTAAEAFCVRTKGLRALPLPHPSTIHSLQLPRPAFEIERSQKNGTILHIAAVRDPLYLGEVRDQPGFIIVRPKLSKLGTASATQWEVLLFREQHGYIPEWVDSMLNPRYAGQF